MVGSIRVNTHSMENTKRMINSVRHKSKPKFFISIGCMIMAVIMLSSCANKTTVTDDEDLQKNTPLTIGIIASPKNQILAEIYANALNRAGYNVENLNEFTMREEYLAAFKAGRIDIAIDLNGELLLALKPKTTQTSAEDVTEALAQALPDGLSVLKASEAENKTRLVTTAALAEKYRLRSFEDLTKICAETVLGGTTDDFKTPGQKLLELEKKYACTFKGLRTFDDENLMLHALQTHDVHIINIAASNPAIEDNGWVVLEEPKNKSIAQNVVPIVREEKVSKNAQTILNEVSAKLDKKSLTILNREMSGNTKKTPIQAAQKWLDNNGFGEVSKRKE